MTDSCSLCRILSWSNQLSSPYHHVNIAVPQLQYTSIGPHPMWAAFSYRNIQPSLHPRSVNKPYTTLPPSAYQMCNHGSRNQVLTEMAV